MVFWIVLYHKAHEATEDFSKKILKGYLILNLLIISGWIILMVSFTISHDLKSRYYIHLTETLYSSFISFVASVCFLFFGIKVYNQITNYPVMSESRKEISSKVSKINFREFSIFIFFVHRYGR